MILGLPAAGVCLKPGRQEQAATTPGLEQSSTILAEAGLSCVPVESLISWYAWPFSCLGCRPWREAEGMTNAVTSQATGGSEGTWVKLCSSCCWPSLDLALRLHAPQKNRRFFPPDCPTVVACCRKVKTDFCQSLLSALLPCLEDTKPWHMAAMAAMANGT